MAIMAITTNSSINVKPVGKRDTSGTGIRKAPFLHATPTPLLQSFLVTVENPF
jgi:hypothetical protein